MQIPPQSIHVSNTRFALVMNEAKAHIALHVSEFYILLCICIMCPVVSDGERKVKFIPFVFGIRVFCKLEELEEAQ